MIGYVVWRRRGSTNGMPGRGEELGARQRVVAGAALCAASISPRTTILILSSRPSESRSRTGFGASRHVQGPVFPGDRPQCIAQRPRTEGAPPIREPNTLTGVPSLPYRSARSPSLTTPQRRHGARPSPWQGASPPIAMRRQALRFRPIPSHPGWIPYADHMQPIYVGICNRCVDQNRHIAGKAGREI